MSFILRASVLAVAIAITAVAGACPDGWQQLRDMCYWASDYELNGRTVDRVCNDKVPGATAVSIHDLDVNAFVSENLFNGDIGLIGFYRASASASWVWSDGSVVNFTYWESGQPNDSGEACTRVDGGSGCWLDGPCDTLYHRFACQIHA